MLRLFLLTALLCSVDFLRAATPYKDCGSTAGTVQSFELTGCTTAPCKFHKGNNYTMNLAFQAKSASSSVSVSIHGKQSIHFSFNKTHISLVSFLIQVSSVVFQFHFHFPIQMLVKCKSNAQSMPMTLTRLL